MRSLHALMLLPLVLTTAGCQTTTLTDATDVTVGLYCRLDRPVTYSSRDTPPTVREIREHNARYHAVCDGARP